MKMLKQEVKTLYDVYFNLFDQIDKEILVIVENETVKAKVFGKLQDIISWRDDKLNMYKIKLIINDQEIMIENPTQITVNDKTRNNTIQLFVDNIMIEFAK
jgi:hypothetical protein